MSRRRQLSDADRHRLLAALELGFGLEVSCKRLAIDRASVDHALDRNASFRRAADRAIRGEERKITPAMQEQIIGALRGGAGIAHTAAALGITRAGVYKLKQRRPGFAERMDEAVAVADDIQEQRLFQRGQHDTVALIFWLKNRRPATWRDRHEFHSEVNQTGEFRCFFADGEAVSSPAPRLPATPGGRPGK